MGDEYSKKRYSHLDQLSTKDLEEILRASALSEEADNPELIDQILEVIAERESEHLPSAEQARRDFDQLYRTLEEPLYPVESSKMAKLGAKKCLSHKQRKWRFKFTLLTAAAVVLVFITCVPVFGHANVIQMVATWTAEQFHFSLPASSKSQGIPKEYAELQKAMEECGNKLLVPEFPSGFEPEEPVFSYHPEKQEIQFMIIWQKQDKFYMFSVKQDSEQLFDLYEYEKTDSHFETYTYNKINHYLLPNSENNTAIWNIGKTEYYVVTNMPLSDLKETIKSMYKE
ncbi:DUF4367 domain-containing protein [Oscillospiraceae bacterium 44-34]